MRGPFSSRFTRHASLSVSTVGQHPLGRRLIGIRDQGVNIKMTLPLGCLLGQYVARVGVPAFYLAGGSEAKTLGCSFVSFEFGHYSS